MLLGLLPHGPCHDTGDKETWRHECMLQVNARCYWVVPGRRGLAGTSGTAGLQDAWTPRRNQTLRAVLVWRLHYSPGTGRRTHDICKQGQGRTISDHTARSHVFGFTVSILKRYLQIPRVEKLGSIFPISRTVD